jgi:hypothetical protein
MIDRGLLAPGMVADVAVFDPAAIIDRATYEDAGQLSEGVRIVLVNGRFALRDGKTTGERAGRVLVRDAHMPTRPMSTGSRRLAVAGRVRTTDASGARPSVTIDVSQSPASPRARGTLRFTDTSTGETFIATDVGVLQTAGSWASVTAIMNAQRSQATHAVTVVVEQADPFVDGHPRTVQIYLDDGRRIAGPV